MDQVCARCGGGLPVVDGATASFCAVCGLPQLRVSAEAASAAGGVGNGGGLPGGAAGGAVGEGMPGFVSGGLDWPYALRVAGVAAGCGLLPSLLLPGVAAVGGAGIFALMLLPLLSLAMLYAYSRRRRQTLWSPGLGARMGAALGVLLAGSLTTVSAVAAFAVRYGMHSPMLGEQISAALAQSQEQMRASGAVAPDWWLAGMQMPEWHAGTFLAVEAAMALLLVTAAVVFGALAGAMLAAKQRRAV